MANRWDISAETGESSEIAHLQARFYGSECLARGSENFSIVAYHSGPVAIGPITVGTMGPIQHPGSHDWYTQISAIAEQAQENLKLRFRESQLERAVADLQQRIRRLEKNQTFVVPIQTFEPEPFDLAENVFVVVQPDEDEFSATHFDSNLNATGENPVEAVENLKGLMLDTFEHFTALEKERKLGVGPKRQLAVLKRYISPRRK